jgi:hypothetical protein
MKWGSMKRKKSGQQALVAYLCHFRPEPEGGFTVSCPKLPPVVTYGQTLAIEPWLKMKDTLLSRNFRGSV